MTITFALSHQIISRTDSMILASGSKNYVTAQFDLLTEDWTAPITAIFDDYTVVLDEDNQCLVPWEVLANPGKVAVSAFCGDLHTATSVLVPVHPGGYIDGQTPQPPTPDVYAQLASMVQTAVDAAQEEARKAGEAATDAETSKSKAEIAAETATGKAAEADSSAAAAKASQTNAAESQEAAASSASTASLKAGEAAAAAETATDQASDAAASAAAAKASETSAAGSADSAAQSAKKAEDAAKSVPLIDDTTISPDHPWSSQKIAETFCPPFEVSGPIVTCNPLVNSPLHVVSQIVPVQEGEGDPSPENVRPINGWTEARLIHRGKNLFDVDFAKNPDSWSGGTKGYVSIDAKLSPNTTYTLSVSQNNMYKDYKQEYNGIYALYIGETPNAASPNLRVGNTNVTKGDTKAIHTFTTGENPYYINVYVNSLTTETLGVIFDELLPDMQIEVGEIQTNYEPYNTASKTIAIQFGQTVYGGTLDWNTGVLTIDHFGRTYTHLDSFYTYSSNGVFSFVTELLDFKGKLNPITTKWMCDTLIPESYNYAGANKKIYSVGTDSGSGALYFRLDNNQEATVEDFKTWIGQHPTTVVADLRTPFSIQLTTTEILALSGVNTLYTDTGDTTVSGLADPLQVIQKLTERIAAMEQNAIGG